MQHPGDPAAPERAPLLLAVETSTAALGVALLRGERVLAELGVRSRAPASQGLLTAIDGVLALAGAGLDEVEAFAVGIGPGSFTGLRVGLATVKGLAFGSHRVVAPVPTLAALARGAGRVSGPVVALLDAQRGEVYAGAFGEGGERRLDVLPEGLYALAHLAECLPDACTLVGEGASDLAGVLFARGRRAGLAVLPFGAPRARDVGVLGARLIARREGEPAETLVPRYVRRAEAEVRRTGEPVEREPAG